MLDYLFKIGIVFFLGALVFTYWNQKTAELPDVYTYPESSKLEFTDSVKRNLDRAYSGMSKEFPFCLHGEKVEDGYKVNKISVPNVYSSEKGRATYSNESCRAQSDFLGMVHNHGSGFCTPSDTDLDRFFNNKAKIEVVTCQDSASTRMFGIIKKDGL